LSGFKFLHAADLHLGSPFHGLRVHDTGVTERLADAGRTAFTALVSRAIEERVAFVVLAGDIYEGEWRDNTIGLFFARELGRLERAGIDVYLLHGNHDAESVVMHSVTLPDSVRVFASDKPTTFRIEALKVALHGQSFAEPAVTENLALNYPNQVGGWFNIGVLHTSLTGYPPHADYAPSTPGHLRARGYDYWALGHVHEYAVLQTRPHIVYAGNLQGRHMGEQGARGAVLVRVEEGEIESVERVIVDRVRWIELPVSVAGETNEATLVRRIEDAVRPLGVLATERLIVLRIVLAGETELHRRLVADREEISAAVEAACQRVHADIWLERVELRTTAPARKLPTAPALASVDLGALLAEVAGDQELGDKARAEVAEIIARLPASVGEAERDFAGDLPALIAEARDLLLARVDEAATR